MVDVDRLRAGGKGESEWWVLASVSGLPWAGVWQRTERKGNTGSVRLAKLVELLAPLIARKKKGRSSCCAVSVECGLGKVERSGLW